MNKSDLITAVADLTAQSKKDVGEVVDALLGVIQAEVAAGRKVAVTGFGAFEAVDRAARIGRNPSTGQAMDLPAKTVPVFKAGSEFKTAVNGARATVAA
ncbi:HU family DNA-binding protein [Spongiactinospora sp. TRM90649]|uniref:HU family DNA-binding protein n=1 Tax=Spongiactinospora sp. TRM90649 TaxID=3031114 RepID=UPI0023F883C4|nr:HU family DNA-binding protein [Spongiactinospora sp. TRM90649]MDF5755836.1 HU family DNA-binding protein [Spongiactinospora sp. TRM90649]